MPTFAAFGFDYAATKKRPGETRALIVFPELANPFNLL